MNAIHGTVMESKPSPSRAEVDDLLKRKRKAREHKACYPCRQRKVRCDSNVPCKTCLDRGHADICTFNPPLSKRQDTGAFHNEEDDLESGHLGPGDTEWDRLFRKLNALERSFTELRGDIHRISGQARLGQVHPHSPAPVKEESREPDGPNYVRAMEVNEQSQMTGQNLHLGGGSVPALVLALRKVHNTAATQDVLGNNLLPLFGLENEQATYPFVDLWGHPRGNLERINELCKALPSDAECLDTFRIYRDVAHVIYPGVAELDQFETDLLGFLSCRHSNQNDTASEGLYDVYGRNIQWLGLLFAAFASGIQFSSRPKEERDPVSQVYVCCSFECLRLVNYISNASNEIIETMLILGNVLANGMNAGAAWSFLGMTLRLAQSLGLHRSNDKAIEASPEQATRSRLWWAVLWQDSLLSISYDRASSAATADCPLPPRTNPDLKGHSYHEAMYRVMKVGLDTVRNRVAPQSIESRLSRCGDLRDEVQNARDRAVDHLRDLGACKSIREQSEFWMLYLHASYMKSELCRPAISPSTSSYDPSCALRRLCIENLMNSVEAFLGIARVAPAMARSWGVTHRALSSALLLGIIGEPIRTPRAQAILCDFVQTMTTITHASDGLGLSAPIQRSMTALRKLSSVESKTPRQLEDLNAGLGTASIGTSDADGYGYASSNPDTSLNFDDMNFFNSDGLDVEGSPYALMDSILWGSGRSTVL